MEANILTIKQKTNRAVPYLFILPAAVLLTLVVLYPIVNSLHMSFSEYKLVLGNSKEFIGLSNYIEVLKDPVFRKSIALTLVWIVFGVGLQFILGLGLALVLNNEFKGRGICRALLMIPWVTPGVIIALMWTWMYDGNYGVINDLLSRMGIIDSFIPWLSRSETVMPSLIVTIVWQGIPFFGLMLLAGLQSIPQELYEAARVDGAGPVKTFFYITLPMLKNTIYVTTLLRVIWVANSVDVIYTMTGGGPANNSMTLSVYTFVKARSSLDFGYASTLSIYLTLMLTVVIFFYLKQKIREEVE